MIFRVIDALDDLMRIYMRICSWFSPVVIAQTSLGFKMHCDIRDFIQRRVRFFGIYEPNLTHYIGSRVRPGETFVDVGANVGYMSLVASMLVGRNGRVISIEASPQTFAALSKNLVLNRAENVRTFNVAATAAPCQVEIVAGEKRNSGSNSIRQAGDESRAMVRGDRLSRILADKKDVSFIKIDVEGSESPILLDILANLDDFPKLESVAAEISPQSGSIVSQFRDAGFKAFALPNNYRIGYLLVRKYLSRSQEGSFVVKIPVTVYQEEFTDYVFERPISQAASPSFEGEAHNQYVLQAQAS